MTRTAILLVDHGSRRPEANAELEALAELVRDRAVGTIVRVAHMELAAPSIAEAIAQCSADGAGEVIVVPCFLAPGRHASEDVPRLVAEAASAHGLRWRVAGVLGAHPLMAELVLVRAELNAGAFVVWRQDDHGNRFEVERFASLDEAEARRAALEELGHKQLYWVEPEAEQVSERSSGTSRAATSGTRR